MGDGAPERDEARLWRGAQFRAARRSGPDGLMPTELETADDDGPRRLRNGDEALRARLLVDDAVRRGQFDNLKYAGKPIPGLGESHDPDWWVKGLIQRENITGLGPKAILLRTEDVELDSRLDAQFAEDQVRGILRDFNSRVIDARRQLLGGPPVVTKTRDVEREVALWRERRAARTVQEPPDPEDPAPPSWWRRLWRGQR